MNDYSAIFFSALVFKCVSLVDGRTDTLVRVIFYVSVRKAYDSGADTFRGE